MFRNRHFIVIAALLLLSCGNQMPAGFWSRFEKQYLVTATYDQGPWGGHRAMHWKASSPATFTRRSAIAFANKNGWTLVDSLHMESKGLRSWYYSDTAIFPLSSSGFDKKPVTGHSEYRYFPRWIHTGQYVYSFTTGMLSIAPGTDESNEVNGFVVISDAGNEMSVYHLWGE